MNGANRYMKISLVVFQEKQLVKVSKLEFVSLPIADQLQPIFYKLPCGKQRIAKLN